MLLQKNKSCISWGLDADVKPMLGRKQQWGEWVTILHAVSFLFTVWLYNQHCMTLDHIWDPSHKALYKAQNVICNGASCPKPLPVLGHLHDVWGWGERQWELGFGWSLLPTGCLWLRAQGGRQETETRQRRWRRADWWSATRHHKWSARWGAAT